MPHYPERPDDLEQREAWAWSEAEFCDLMSKNYRGPLLDGWKDRPDYVDNAIMQAKCLINAEVWEQMARHLRQSYYARKEREAYDATRLSHGQAS
ncbi:hypothetical protein HHL08_15915 [Sphingobium sp. AR-3-1]|uniref:Uncharacterized protein n=1 Tax=Sphingobium psychrophilum TaxID=2728834 RepID=A0A7X9ZTH1_9SPHN|nr:hypothetical protein [Sphingobium psychrophilum]NML11617.1 hypothetical protein [Sphingobium psychrophilum]